MDENILKIAQKEISKKIDVKKSFNENNFDSLDLMTFIAICEDYHEIKINESDYSSIKSFSSLDKLIKKKITK